MANFNDAFAPEGGINLEDLVGIFAGTIDPSAVGEAAPIGSLYLRSTGSVFVKIGAPDTSWTMFSTGGGGGVKITGTDTTADNLNTKLLTTAALTKTIQNSGANETLTLDLTNVGTAGTYRSVTTNAKGQVTAGTNPTTIAGYGLTDAQPLDADLTAIAALATTGYLTRTGANTWATRTMIGTANQIDVTTGNGSTLNTVFSIANDAVLPGTAGATMPTGTTAQRVNATGRSRYNTDTNALEYFNGTVWVSLAAGTGGTVTSVSLALPSIFTVTGSPVTTTGTLTGTLAAQSANTVFAGPTTGTAAPTFRGLFLDELVNVDAPTPAVGQMLVWSGTAWIPYGGAGGGGGLRTFSGNIVSQTGTSIFTPAVAVPTTAGGTEIVSQVITPLATASRFSIQLAMSVSASTNNNVHTAAVFRSINGGAATYLGGAIQTFATGGNSNAIAVNLTDAPNTLLPVTYTIRYGTNAGTWYINRRVSENTYGGVNSGWEIQEY